MKLDKKVIDERKRFIESLNLNTNKILYSLPSELRPLEKLQATVNYIKKLNLDIKIFEKFPKLFTYSIENLQNKVKYITKNLGLDLKSFNTFPALFGYSDSKIKLTYDYLLNTLKLPRKKFYPFYFSYSLKRIKKCFEYMTMQLGFKRDRLNIRTLMRSVTREDVESNIEYLKKTFGENLPSKLNYYRNPNILLKIKEKFKKCIDNKTYIHMKEY